MNVYKPFKSALRKDKVPIIRGEREPLFASQPKDKQQMVHHEKCPSKPKYYHKCIDVNHGDETISEETKGIKLLSAASTDSKKTEVNNLCPFTKDYREPTNDIKRHTCPANSEKKSRNSGLYTYMESLRREVTMNDSYDEIIGHDAVKDAIENAFVSTYCMAKEVHPDLSIRSFLLIGVPGIGKTGIMVNTASRIAKLIKRPISVFAISAAEILSKYIGESEKSITTLWEVVQAKAPSLVLLDEVDAIMRARNNEESEHSRRIKNQLLSQMEGIHPLKHVVIIASTNRGQDLDDAFLRRFKRKFLLRPPTGPERLKILQKFLQKDDAAKNLTLTVDQEKLFIDHTHNFTGDDIKTAVTFAIAASIRVCHNTELYETKHMNSIRTELEQNGNPPIAIIQPLKWEVLLRSIHDVIPSLKVVDVKSLNKWAKKVCKSSSLEDSNTTQVDEARSSHGGLVTLFHLL